MVYYRSHGWYTILRGCNQPSWQGPEDLLFAMKLHFYPLHSKFDLQLNKHDFWMYLLLLHLIEFFDRYWKSRFRPLGARNVPIPSQNPPTLRPKFRPLTCCPVTFLMIYFWIKTDTRVGGSSPQFEQSKSARASHTGKVQDTTISSVSKILYAKFIYCFQKLSFKSENPPGAFSHCEIRAVRVKVELRL